MCSAGTCRQCRLEDRVLEKAMNGVVEPDRKLVRRKDVGDRASTRTERRKFLVKGDNGKMINTSPDCVHGTSSAYGSFGCRCDQCDGYDARKKAERLSPARQTEAFTGGLFK